MAVGIEGEERVLAETIPFLLFVPGPRAAARCLSEHTLVLFLKAKLWKWLAGLIVPLRDPNSARRQRGLEASDWRG